MITMTMGTVLVACLAARVPPGPWNDEDIDFEMHQLGYKAWVTIEFSLCISVLNDDVLPLDITEISQPLLESPRPKARESLRSPVGDTYPISGTFFGCCASAITATASNTTTTRIDGTAVLFIAHLVSSVIYHAERDKGKCDLYDEKRQRLVAFSPRLN